MMLRSLLLRRRHYHILVMDSVRVDLRKTAIVAHISIFYIPFSLYFIYLISFWPPEEYAGTSYRRGDARLRVIRTTYARGDIRPESYGLQRGEMIAGCEESYLRERAPRRDTGAREVIARGDSCGLSMRRCGQQRMRISGRRGTLFPAARYRVRSAPGHVAMRGAVAEGPAYARVTGARSRVGGGLRTGGEPYDTLGMRETGVFEGRDAAAVRAAQRAAACSQLLAYNEGMCRPRPHAETYTHGDGLTRAGVRVAVEAEWRGDAGLNSPICSGVAEWHEKAACVGRGAWVRAEFGGAASLAMSA
ncbi:hypothetical protein C8R44DRAFT_862692, partial [Mycena epipterygia]